MTRPGKIPTHQAGIEPGSSALETDALTIRPTRRSHNAKRRIESTIVTVDRLARNRLDHFVTESTQSLFVGCLTSQQHASVSRGRICSDNCTCCHTEIEVADPTFYLTQSQYTDTGPTSPSADPRTPGAWQGSHWSANF